MKLTIAQFLPNLHLAGQQRVVVDLAKAFKAKGHNSIVCCTIVGGELVRELEASNIAYSCLKVKNIFNPLSYFKVVRYLKDNGVDVVITHGNYRIVPRIASLLRPTPVVLHVEHNISEYKKPHHILLNKIMALFTDKIVCVSEGAMQSLLTIEKQRPDKIVVIKNGLSTDRFPSITRIPRDRNSMKRKVAIVGRFTDQKGHIYFVEAAARIIRSYKNVEFIFVGDGPLKNVIERRVKECGLETCSSFLGVRSDVGDLLQTFDVFVLSSVWEGLPISLLEAQYFGVASVVTNVGGNPEIIRNGYNGLLVPPRDPDALASAVINLLKNDAMRDEMGQYAKRLFAEKYSLETMADAYIHNINNILSGKGSKQCLVK